MSADRTWNRLGGAAQGLRTTRAYGLARSVGGRAVRTASGAGVRARASLPRRGYVPGLLSVVVPCYDVEAYLDECLTSLRFQHYRNVEIIVVDDGSPDASADIARAHRRRDLRVRLVRRENGGLSAARNTGIERARGEFLTFVDSDDVVQPEAFSAAIAALRESGSDFALTNYDRLDRGRRKRAEKWIRHAHLERRLGATVDDFPEAMVNATAWSKTYRREFWDEAGLSFPVGQLYEDQPVSIAAFARAKAFDVLPEIGVSWRIRHDRSSISQASSTARNLAAHNAAVHASLLALHDAGKPHAAELRALQVLANNMRFFVRHILHADQEFWQLLREGIGDLVGTISHDLYLRQVAAQHKVLYALVIDDRPEDAKAFLRAYGTDARRFPTELGPDGMRVDLPFTEDLPADTLLLSDSQLELVTRTLRVVWEASGDLRVTGWAYVRNIDLADNPAEIELDLVGPDGTRTALQLERYDEPRLDLVGDHFWCDYRSGGFTATLPASELPQEPGEYRFRVRFAAAGVTREDVIREVSPAGSAGFTRSRVLGAGRVASAGISGGSLALTVRHAPAHALAVHADEAGRLAVRFIADEQPRLVSLSVPGRAGGATATPVSASDGTWTASLPLPPTRGRRPASPGLRVSVTSTSGAVTDVLAPPDLPEAPGLPLGDGRAVVRGRRGDLEVLDRLPVATGYQLDDDEFTVTLTGAPRDWVPLLHVNGDGVEGRLETGDDGEQRITFPLTVSRWGREGLALRRGKYAVGLVSASGQTLPVAVPGSLVDRLPVTESLPRYGAIVELFPGPPATLALLLREPLADDERGPRNQRRLRAEARVERADRDSVFFRALYGEVANCNGLGVHQELLRRGTDLTLYWSVRDHSVPVPPGGVGVVEGTRAWHDAIARSRYHMVNVHQFDWFHKPEGQVIIETMHGYPYKVMGHEWWRKGGFPGAQVANYDRRAREWDYFVSPATYATPLLKAAFLEPAGAEPTILEIGYPRNDVLVSAEGEEVRRSTRAQLGARDDQVVVLYAPTFRDYLSADDMTAERVDFFDVDAAARQLGDGYVILVRGHAFNARAKSRLESRGNIVDVTDHPDINDLILASDAAVLDYSSLRFDYALTGKPMVFLISDLQEYDHARGGVIDYLPTAPGPRIRTTAETVRHLRDLPALRTATADRIAQFRREYVDLDDGHAGARLVDAVFVPRGDAPTS